MLSTNFQLFNNLKKNVGGNPKRELDSKIDEKLTSQQMIKIMLTKFDRVGLFEIGNLKV